MVGPLPYIGGKNRLATTIIAMLPPHVTYVEAFAGGAQVFFHKPPSEVEVLNDLDLDITNFFRCCQWHYEELVRHLRFSVASRKWFDLLLATDPATLTDIQRASRFFYLQKNCFGGLVRKRHFHYSLAKTSNFNPARIPEIIQKTHDRLAHVQVECLPYEQVLIRYDSPQTLFYVDPPYWGRKLYRFDFTERDFQALRERLAGLKGKFILSLNDTPEVRRLFQDFVTQDASLTYTSRLNARTRYNEVIIMNFTPSGNQ